MKTSRFGRVCALCLGIYVFLAGTRVAADEKLLIFDFNRDCAADTLCGDINGDTVVPTHIRWGDHAPCPPPPDPFPDSLRHARTMLKLPPWLCMKVMAIAANMNAAQDATDDLTMFMKGKSEDGQGGYLDMKCVLLVFGRYGLDTLDTLNLCLVTSSSLSLPFAAMKLSSSNFSRPTELWPGFNSALASPLTIPTPKEGIEASSAAAPALSGSISPTPSKDHALLTVRGLPATRQHFHIVDARGRPVQRFSLPGGPELQHRLDLSALAAGQYSILVAPDQTYSLRLPLIIVR